jgi:hypothetical protein
VTEPRTGRSSQPHSPTLPECAFKTQPPYAAGDIFKPEISVKEGGLSGVKSFIYLMLYQKSLRVQLNPMTWY